MLSKIFDKALSIYQKSCERGVVRSCINLGHMYEKGQGVKQDSDKALSIYQKGCEDGDPLGCSNLGFIRK